jgi:hypothetical protein
MTPKTKQGLIIATIGLLAVIAVAGWTRNPNPGVSANSLGMNITPQGVYTANQLPPGAAQPVAYDAGGRAIYGQPAYAPPAAHSAYANNCIEPMGVHSAAYAPPAYQTRYRTYNRPRVVRTYVERDRDYVVRKNRRSTGKSVAIVAGSAGAGAAIGALAGGGKGAAIGALTGGAAGFVYDRLTHNR